MRNFLCGVLVLLTLFSCEKKEKTKVDVSNILIETKVTRFEVDFYSGTEKTLPSIKKKYP